MNIHEIIHSIRTFVVYQPFVAMGIAAAIGFLIWIKPKQVLRLILIAAGICAAGYVLYYLWGAFQSGYLNKGEMINKSL
jgi:hypothetical protein